MVKYRVFSFYNTSNNIFRDKVYNPFRYSVKNNMKNLFERFERMQSKRRWQKVSGSYFEKENFSSAGFQTTRNDWPDVLICSTAQNYLKIKY